MNFGVLFEQVTDAQFPTGYYYAHIPSLGLTTHGLGIEGARREAFDLAQLWLAEKKASGDQVTASSDILFSMIELPADGSEGT
jgi:predicted RNase H-like HicB family nuclease